MQNDRKNKIVIVVPDPLSGRIFFECGVLDALAKMITPEKSVLVFPERKPLFEDWSKLFTETRTVWISDEKSHRSVNLTEKVWRRIDGYLDTIIGWYPLALRFNLQHGFHLERMAPGHANWYLDLDRMGKLPNWRMLYRLMFKWTFNSTRYVERSIGDVVNTDIAVLVSTNLQFPGMHKYVVAARRRGIPIIANIASWDHTVGKGVIYPDCRTYLVQNASMKEDLVEYHAVPGDRITVTGWPQTDVFARKWSKESFQKLVSSFGLDTSKRLVLITGNTLTNAPYEHKFLEKFITWWRANSCEYNVIFRPHPKDRKWRIRFENVYSEEKNLYFQPPSYTDMDQLACLLQHADCVVTHAGTILLDSILNNRPAVCVVYDEGDGSTSVADKNVVGKHYEELMGSGAFITAKSFDEVTKGVEDSLRNAGAMEMRRREISKRVVGEVDGRAAVRLASAISDSWWALASRQETLN